MILDGTCLICGKKLKTVSKGGPLPKFGCGRTHQNQIYGEHSVLNWRRKYYLDPVWQARDIGIIQYGGAKRTYHMTKEGRIKKQKTLIKKYSSLKLDNHCWTFYHTKFNMEYTKQNRTSINSQMKRGLIVIG